MDEGLIAKECCRLLTRSQTHFASIDKRKQKENKNKQNKILIKMSPSRNGWRLVTVSSRPVIVFSLERVKNKKMCAFFHTSCTVSKRRGGGGKSISYRSSAIATQGRRSSRSSKTTTAHVTHLSLSLSTRTIIGIKLKRKLEKINK